MVDLWILEGSSNTSNLAAKVDLSVICLHKFEENIQWRGLKLKYICKRGYTFAEE